jgi:hypothetical protein
MTCCHSERNAVFSETPLIAAALEPNVRFKCSLCVVCDAHDPFLIGQESLQSRCDWSRAGGVFEGISDTGFEGGGRAREYNEGETWLL